MRDDPQVTDLVTRASGGDRQAWDALVGRYAPLVWSICRRYRLSGADAEDAGQAVWLHPVEHLRNLRDPAALPGWLATTTRRECCRIRRAARRRPDSGDHAGRADRHGRARTAHGGAQRRAARGVRPLPPGC